MKICPNCGKGSDARFCPYCGTRLPEMKICPCCGRPTDSKFCPDCGAKIDPGSEPFNDTADKGPVNDDPFDGFGHESSRAPHEEDTFRESSTSSSQQSSGSREHFSAGTSSYSYGEDTGAEQEAPRMVIDPIPPKKRFYQRGWFVILMLILFWPVGIALMWCYKVFPKVARIIITCIVGLIVAVNVFLIFFAESEDDYLDDTDSYTIENQFKDEPSGDTGSASSGTDAIEEAQSYSDTCHLSEQGLFNQLTSEYGAGLPPEEARAAIAAIDVDYNYNALMSGKSYLETFPEWDEEELYEQLTSEFGEAFTDEQADYAIQHLY